MTASPASAAARLLGTELRSLRLLRRRNGEQVARAMRWSATKVSRTETAHRAITADDLERLLRYHQADDGLAARLRALRETAAAGLLDEDTATEVLLWAPGEVPPILRTEAYARAVFASTRRVTRMPPSAIRDALAADRAWLARLRDPEEGEPLTLAAVLDESVLHRRRGGAGVMAAQLGQLAELARLPCVDLRVMPLDADGPAFGPYTLLGFGGDDLVDTVLLTGPEGTARLTDDREVLGYRYAHEDMQAAAADTEETAALIKQAAGGWS